MDMISIRKQAPDSVRVPVVCFSIGAMNSEGMLSDNPSAGIHETNVARTIDANGSNPAGWQGGDVVIQMKDVSPVGNDPNMIAVYDARGNGEGDVVPTITGDHENRITDYTAVLCYSDREHRTTQSIRVGGVLASSCPNAEITDGKISPTIMARAGTGGNQLPLIVYEFIQEE